MDVDGTLTDGKIYMGPQGECMKAFSVKDGYVIKYILKPAEITPVILTARNSEIVNQRCKELGIKDIYQGKEDKLTALKEMVEEKNLGSCAYFGDDILDLNCMIPIKEAGGRIGCPADAVQEVKAIADFICLNKAGEGALREFSEWLVKNDADDNCVKERVEKAVNYLKHLTITENDIGKKVRVDENFYYVVESYFTKPQNECRLESHRNYVDIHLMVYGKEKMEIADVSRLTVRERYEKEADVMYWEIPDRMLEVTLKQGDSIILYPEHAHRTGQMRNESEKIIKIVGKVKVNER